MEFLELAKSRFSVRKFKADPIPQELVDQILQAGAAAPTACNNQPQKILVIQSEEGLEKLRKCTECHFGAPLAFLVCYDRTLCWQRRYDGKTSGDIDASIVATHMMLEAASLGIGSTWVMYFIPEAVREEFALSDDLEPVALLVMGCPAPDAQPAPRHSSRKDLGETVSFV